MAEYMLFLHESPEDFKDYSPEEIQKIIMEYREWHERTAKDGTMIEGHKLTDEPGKVLRPDRGKVLVTDGPYSETKEVIGGMIIVKAANYDEAIEIAKSSPHLAYGGRIEVRQIDDLSQQD